MEASGTDDVFGGDALTGLSAATAEGFFFSICSTSFNRESTLKLANSSMAEEVLIFPRPDASTAGLALVPAMATPVVALEGNRAAGANAARPCSSEAPDEAADGESFAVAVDEE